MRPSAPPAVAALICSRSLAAPAASKPAAGVAAAGDASSSLSSDGGGHVETEPTSTRARNASRVVRLPPPSKGLRCAGAKLPSESGASATALLTPSCARSDDTVASSWRVTTAIASPASKRITSPAALTSSSTCSTRRCSTSGSAASGSAVSQRAATTGAISARSQLAPSASLSSSAAADVAGARTGTGPGAAAGASPVFFSAAGADCGFGSEFSITLKSFSFQGSKYVSRPSTSSASQRLSMDVPPSR